MIFLYQIFIFCFILAYLPYFFFEFIFKEKYRGRIKEKLGLKRYSFNFKKETLWVHAVSVGEIKAVSTLVKKYHEAYPSHQIIISSITETGHAEAKRCLSFAHHHILLPIDLKGVVKRLLNGLNLKLVVIVETDLWPNFLSHCKKIGAKIALVNGKISERSFLRLRKFPPLALGYFSFFDLVLVQDALYQERMIKLGVSEKKLQIVPNLKLDDVYPVLEPKQMEKLKGELGVSEECITLGSTHEGEELALLQALKPLLKERENLKMFLVPRHVHRIPEIEKILRSLSLDYGKWSDPNRDIEKKILLVDVMGYLRTCYQLSNVAIVAGSFVPKIGGHNILEPLWYSTPALFGPYMYGQSQFVHLIKQAKSGLQVTLAELSSVVKELLENHRMRTTMGENGRLIFDHASGGSERTLKLLTKLLANN